MKKIIRIDAKIRAYTIWPEQLSSVQFNERADYGHIQSVHRSINSDFNLLQSTTIRL